MIKLSELLAEVSAMDEVVKTASKKTPASKFEVVADALSKLAEEMSESEDESEKDEEEKEEEKSEEEEMKLSNAQLDKIASLVVNKLEKIAVGGVQGSAVNEGPASTDGSLTNEARKTDQIVAGATVESQIASNPHKNAPEDGDHTIEKSEINDVGKRPEALGGMGAAGGTSEGTKIGKVVYSAEEADVLQKLAGIGYEYLVDYYSDQIVQEKVAQAVMAERAKDAPQKIARAILSKEQNTEKTAAKNTMKEKLAHIQRTDPDLFAAIKILSDRNLL